MQCIAHKMGITETELRELLAGQVPAGVARGLKNTPINLKNFVAHGHGFPLEALTGCDTNALDELGSRLGPVGACGFLAGLLLGLSLCSDD